MVKSYIYTGETEHKGKGMFTNRIIKAGTIIERAPVIVMSATERLLIDQTKLYNYIFEWQPDGADLCCMALGNIPMYNHSYSSNCEYYMEYENNEMFVQAVRDIAAGEELTINYNGSWDDESKVWFDVAE
jgi:SET domain-containing protein